jgi:hypothetical protein
METIKIPKHAPRFAAVCGQCASVNKSRSIRFTLKMCFCGAPEQKKKAPQTHVPVALGTSKQRQRLEKLGKTKGMKTREK